MQHHDNEICHALPRWDLMAVCSLVAPFTPFALYNADVVICWTQPNNPMGCTMHGCIPHSHTSARQVPCGGFVTIQGMFPISSANIPCLPYRMWPGSRDETPFLLILDMLDKEEHLERGRRVHYSHFKRFLKYRRVMKGQGLGREGAG